MTNVTETSSNNWYKKIALFIGSVNLFAFCTGIVYLVIMQGYFINEDFLGWSFSLEDAFFRGWIFILSEYTWTYYTIIFIPILYIPYILYKKGELIPLYVQCRRIKKRIFSCACCACAKILREKQTLNKRYKNKLNRRLKSIFFQRESERVVFGAVIIVYGIFISMIYGLPYMLSIAHYAERDAKNLQWSAIACQTLPSSNCYCYRSFVKDGQAKKTLLGALVYKNPDSIWLLDDKGLLHIVSAKDVELSRMSDEKFEFD